MKFLFVAIAAVIAASTANADLEKCSIEKLLPIAKGDEAKQCENESKFSVAVAALTGNAPKPEQFNDICKSAACKSVLNKLYDAVPTDCQLSAGKPLKSLTDPVKNACFPPPTL